MFNFSEKINHYFYHAKHMGELDITKANICMVEIMTPDGYTHLQLFIEFAKDNEEILLKNIKFKVLGCPTAIACVSFICEYLIGKQLSESKKITAEFLIKTLDIAKERYAIAGLVEDLVYKLETH